MSAVICKNLLKTFKQGDEIIYGLNQVDLNVLKDNFVCLSGASEQNLKR